MSQIYVVRLIICFVSLPMLVMGCSEIVNKSSKFSFEPHLNLFDLYDEQAGTLSATSISVKTSIRADMALTTLTYTIYNRSNREAEAMFQLALPPSAKVVGYGLDINGVMIDGEIVPKEKGRQAFNEIQEQRIDPGLAEIIKGNIFQTEVYPVLAGQTRKVKIVYSERLSSDKTGNVEFLFPFSKYSSGIDLDISIDISESESAPLLLSKPYSMKAFRFQDTNNRFELQSSYTGGSSWGDLKDFKFSFLPKSGKQLNIAAADNGNTYFSFSLPIQEQYLESKYIENENISIYWDVSSSMEKSHAFNKSILESYLNSKRAKSIKTLNIFSYAFDIDAPKLFDLSVNSSDEIIDYIDSLQYDGATHFSQLNKSLSETTSNFSIIFSDGINSVGSADIVENTSPVYFIAVGDGINQPFVKAYASLTGGMFFNASRTNFYNAVDIIGIQNPVLNVSFSDQNAITEVYTEYVYGELPILNVVGIVNSLDVRLIVDVNDRNMSTISFDDIGVESNGFAKYAWASMKLDSLLGKNNKSELIEFGLNHGIVTPHTSLIVLEELEQYAEFGIEPPGFFKNQKGFKRKWDEILEDFISEAQDEKQEHLNFQKEVLESWSSRTKWWKSRKSVSMEDAIHLFKDKQIPYERDEEIVVTGIRASLQRSMDIQRNSSGSVDVISAEDIGEFPETSISESLLRATEGEHVEERVLAVGCCGARPNVDINLPSNVNRSMYTLTLQATKDDDRFDQYLQLKRYYAKNPAFFMDVSLLFFENGRKDLALRVLSNLIEFYPEVPDLLKMTAYNMIKMEFYDEAIVLLEDIKALLPFEPESYRDLAIAWERSAIKSGSQVAYRKSMEYYYQAIIEKNETFDEKIPVTALTELNRIRHKAESVGISSIEIDEKFIQLMDMDVRVVMSWNSRMTDIDLWVIEPTGEKVFYKNSDSVTGAIQPFDIVNGYGPEEYMSRFAIPGEYQLKAKYYSNDSVELLGPTTLTVDIYSNYGRENEEVQTVTLRLEKEEDVVDVGTFTIH